MAGRLAIDFGTCNTVAALWDPATRTAGTLPLGELSVPETFGERAFHSVPSLIHYEAGKTTALYGRQVMAADALAHPHTFRWMKKYLTGWLKKGGPVRPETDMQRILPRRIGQQEVDYRQAAGDFLARVLLEAGAYADFAEEVAFAVPVEAFEAYQNWLDLAAAGGGVGQARFIDEASAAAVGYSARLRPGDVFAVFDIGGGTADAAVVRLEETPHGGRRCHLLGKGGARVGGSEIDEWLARDVALRAGCKETELRRILPLLFPEAERVKKRLSDADTESFGPITDPVTGAVLQTTCTRSRLEDLLDERGFYTKLNAVLDQAEAAAREHGFDRSSLRACLMIGGSSLIPSVRRLVRTRYGELTRWERPFDAVAVGAAAWIAGAGFDDRIRHEYVCKPLRSDGKGYCWQTIVRAGTPYPCEVIDPQDGGRPLVLPLIAAREQQTGIALQVWEVSHPDSLPCTEAAGELVYDQNGMAQFVSAERRDDAIRRELGTPTCIPATPPARKGETRFEARFSIDARKFLCVTVKDLQTGRLALPENYPMVKLT